MKAKLEAFLFNRDDLSRRELVSVGVLAVLVAMIFNAPMVPRMTNSMPEIGFGDPYLTAWMVAWDGHALIEQPAEFWNSNTFWPYEDTLAFSDALIGYAPAGLVGEGVEAAIVRHNLLYLFAHAFAFFCAFLLAREFGVSTLAALAAGAVFVYAPWHLDQRTHLHVISSGGIPLAMFLFARGYRRRRPWMIVIAALVSIWQISLGFTLGIPLGYSLAALGIVGLVIHRVKKGEPFSAAILIASSCAVVLVGAWVLWQASPYYRVVDEHPEARRTIGQVRFYSAPPSGLVTSPEANYAWGEVTKSMRADLRWPSEQALFPGAAAVALGVVGLASKRERWVRALLGLGVVVCLYLSMGLEAPVLYELLYNLVPGFDGIRVPGRLMTLTSLGLGCLAALGCQHLIDRNASHPKAGRGRALVIALVPIVILIEGAGVVDVTTSPLPASDVAVVEGPRAEIPSDGLTDRIYMFWSVDGFYPIVNGESGFAPQTSVQFRTLMPEFPSEASVDLLHSLNVETVVFHPDMVGFEISTLGNGEVTPEIEQLRTEHYQRMTTVDISGLGLTRDIRDDAIIFTLDDVATGQ